MPSCRFRERGPSHGMVRPKLRFPGGARVFALALGCSVLGQPAVLGQTPTPGPAQRAGQAVDQAVRGIGDELKELAVAARVRVALLEDLKEAGLRVKVAVQGDRVVLSGEVPSASARVAAFGSAKRVAGVRTVSNEVSVAATPPPEVAVGQAAKKVERTLADALLEARVKVRLLEDLGRVGFSINVAASAGAVVLGGEVPDEARRGLAVAVAARTAGVASVTERLRVAAP